MNLDQKLQRKQPQRRERRERQELLFFCLIQILFGIGIVISPAIWMILVALLIFRLLIRRYPLGLFKRGLALVLIYFVIMESSIFLFMIKDRVLPDRVKGTETILIPGAGIKGLKPDLYLKLRLDRAAVLLKEYPQMMAVVSGLQAADEIATEAFVMKSYLVKLGIEESRILEEPKGQDTIRNFEYAKRLTEEQGLDQDIVIVTNDFHSFRTGAIARSLGFKPLSAPVLSPGPLFLKYLIRETASLAKVQLHFGFSLK